MLIWKVKAESCFSSRKEHVAVDRKRIYLEIEENVYLDLSCEFLVTRLSATVFPIAEFSGFHPTLLNHVIQKIRKQSLDYSSTTPKLWAGDSKDGKNLTT